MERPSGGGSRRGEAEREPRSGVSREQRADRRTDARVSAVPCPARAMPSEKEEDDSQLEKEERNEIRQLSRLTGVTYGVINRIKNKKLRD